MWWEPSKGMARLVFTLRCITGVMANSLSLFLPDPGAPVSVYNAGVTNGVTTYLLGCNASASATGKCDFTAPITMIEGPDTFHAEVTTLLTIDKTQSFTLDCPSGTRDQCNITALNSAWQTTTIPFPPSNFSSYVIAIPTVASLQALLYNGVPQPTAPATENTRSSAIATSSFVSASSRESTVSKSSTHPTASSTSNPSHLPSPKAKSYTWVAGAVITPLSLILLIISGLFYRQKKKIAVVRVELEKSEETIGEIYGRSELHGDSLVLPQAQWNGRPRSELPAREPAAAELF